MQWIISKQIAVEAETPEEAVTKIAEGKTISFSVNARPTPGTLPVRPGAQPTIPTAKSA